MQRIDINNQDPFHLYLGKYFLSLCVKVERGRVLGGIELRTLIQVGGSLGGEFLIVKVCGYISLMIIRKMFRGLYSPNY